MPDSLAATARTAAEITIDPLSGAIGAEIGGVDLANDLSDATIAAIRAALNRHKVIFFRDQALDAQSQKALARRFGPLFRHPNFRPTDANGDPDIVEIVRRPGDGRIVGEDWHTDTTMVASPPMAAILHAVEVPAFGGDTVFADQGAAYRDLSPALRAMLDGLNAVHDDSTVAGPAVAMNASRSTRVREDADWRPTVAVHPVVRTHPETGEKCLFVNASYTRRFEGWTEAESRPLLDFLFRQGERAELTCRFRWRPGSVAFWDNRSTKHIAVNDAQSGLRHMRRVQIAGDQPS